MDWLIPWPRRRQDVCKACGTSLLLAPMPELSGRHGEALVVFKNLPALQCGTEGHPRRYPHPDFGAQLMEAIFWNPDMPVTRIHRRKGVKCCRCDEGMRHSQTRTGVVDGTLSIQDLPPFDIRIRGAVANCPKCDTQQLVATQQVSSDIADAIVDAFKQVDLKP